MKRTSMENSAIKHDVATLTEAQETPSADSVEQSRCLNCGELLAEGVHFCPQCGQSTNTGRLRSKDLAINSLGTITRLNRGVFYTCVNLLWRPWRVIAGYIHGQRTTYTDPVKLLIGLCFILIALKAMFNLTDGEAQAQSIFGNKEDSPFIHFLLFFAGSDTLHYLISFLPVAPVVMFFNRKDKVFHYNFAECIVGALYMSDATLLLNLLCLPLHQAKEYISTAIIFTYLMVMGSMLVYKSFRHFGLSRKRRISKVIGVILLLLLSYLLIIIFLAIAIGLFAIVGQVDIVDP